ncbi:hypothetical protein CEXT_434561 [Caerostris extrusa]|uniref:Uncharacterized protein n=1 Tax=Caerostris extrusa TaxID=172846 RepID=A0AAV4R6E3_CAEEX|nr:hypothetical protein CEXT_434561 [Caerostris extrusa]
MGLDIYAQTLEELSYPPGIAHIELLIRHRPNSLAHSLCQPESGRRNTSLWLYPESTQKHQGLTTLLSLVN